MNITKEIFNFISEVARVASESYGSPFTYAECVEEYTDQIQSNDYACVVAYADCVGVKIPNELRG